MDRPEIRRYLSRHVTVDGRLIGLAIVTVKSDGTAVAETFERETAGTSYTDKPIYIAQGRILADTPLVDD